MTVWACAGSPSQARQTDMVDTYFDHPHNHFRQVYPSHSWLRSFEGGSMSEENWHQARLIPTSGLNGDQEKERRATSALLAVMGAVKEFSRALLSPLGAPAGTLETYIEVPFLLGDQRVFPDGLIRVSRGSRSWTALVEVKTG